MSVRQRAAQLESALASAIDRGDTQAEHEARNALAANCAALAYRVAGKLRRVFPFVDPEELAADCMVGIVKASRSWMPGKGTSFMTWAHNGAAFWARGSARRHNHRGFTGLSGRPTFVPVVLDTAKRFGEPDSVAEMLPAPEPSEPDLSPSERAAVIARALSGLDGRSRLVLKLRYADGLTLAEAGERLGVSKERVRQIQNQALQMARANVARPLRSCAAADRG